VPTRSGPDEHAEASRTAAAATAHAARSRRTGGVGTGPVCGTMSP
jgi:hypothetical protein